MSFADRWVPVGASTNWLHTYAQRYGLAILAVIVATLARYAVGVAFGLLPPFILFYPTIIVVGLLAGFWPSIVATLLSTASIAFFFLAPLNQFGVSRRRDIVWLGLFTVIGLVISGLADLYRRREGRLREFERVVEGLEEMIVVVDRDYRYLIANRAFLTYRGMKREDLIGRSVSEVLNPGVFETTVKQKLDESFQGKTVRYEMRYKYPDRGERDLVITYFPIDGPDGVDRVASVLQDVTEQKQAEISLTLFRKLIDQSNDAVEVIDPETLRLLDVNEKACKDLGYTRKELLSMSVYDVDPAVDDACRATVVEALREKGFIVKEATHRRKDGSTFPVEASLKFVQLDRSYVVAVSRDISDRRKAEEAARESEDRYRDLVEHSEDLVCTHDLDGRLLSVNPAPARLLGYDVSEILKIPMRDMIVPEYRDRFNGYLARIKQNGSDKGLMMVMTRSGERRTWEYSNTLRADGVAAPVVRGIAHDVTERRRAELALQSSEQRYRMLFEKTVAGVAIIGMDGFVIDCNDAWARMFGYSVASECRGSQMAACYPDPKDRQEFLQELRRCGALLNRELELRRKDGTPLWLLLNSVLLTDEKGQSVIQSTVSDITPHKRSDEALRQSEERFRVALKDSPITVFNQDCDLRYTWIYNPQLYWQQDVIGKTDEEIIGPKEAAGLSATKNRVLKCGTPAREEVAIPQNGNNSVFDMTIEPLFDGDRNVVGITGSYIDIARLREMTDRLQEAKDKLVEEKLYLESEIQTELGFKEIIGQSPALREVLKKTRIVAPTDSTVLLLGETGTGKELIARSVHSRSARREQTFVKLNCAAVPSGLLESELFGHEKGAFTGAVSKKIGRIELADKGTLFLDEIGELPLELQPKLLRVLQDREFERLGGVQTLHVNVRIISATNRDLHQDVADRKFREDLFYRLNVFPIEMPPLRERRDDIPVLVWHFVHKHAKKMGKHIDAIPDEVMHTLRTWSWPGNIRELENMIERMVILSKSHELAEPPAELEDSGDLAEDNLIEIEREHIIRVLRETNGVLSGNDGAASRLGVKRTTLQSMMKRLGIESQEYRRAMGTFGK